MNFSSQPSARLAAALIVAGCQTGGGVVNIPDANLDCTIPTAQILDGGPGKDGIPALDNPTLVGPGDAGASYLLSDDRVMGLVVDGQPIAVPLNIQWWHEIVNFDLGDHRLAVTHCPLTGSSIVFDRRPARNATFGVSGLLFMNNLIMFDRNTDESLWPQMARGARCGPKSNLSLPAVASLEITWAGWRELHPQTQVVSSQTGFGRVYTREGYPYGDYDRLDDPNLFFPMPQPVDRRRPAKERVLGIPADSTGGIAFPFGALEEQGPLAAVHATVGGVGQVVFWDGARRAAAAYVASTGDQALTFRVQDGAIVDEETGSTWRVDRLGTAGPLAGTQLEAVADAFVAYWFAWAAFYPSTELWTGGAP